MQRRIQRRRIRLIRRFAKFSLGLLLAFSLLLGGRALTSRLATADRVYAAGEQTDAILSQSSRAAEAVSVELEDALEGPSLEAMGRRGRSGRRADRDAIWFDGSDSFDAWDGDMPDGESYAQGEADDFGSWECDPFEGAFSDADFYRSGSADDSLDAYGADEFSGDASDQVWEDGEAGSWGSLAPVTGLSQI